MKLFKLPDLGEGLPDAVIREWHVAEGDTIAAHAPLVTVETAKALVEVPAPWGGRIEKLFAAEDETLDVGQPLVGFAEEADRRERDRHHERAEPSKETADAGTVVGRIQAGGGSIGAELAPQPLTARRATPSVRALARLLRVDLDQLTPAAERFTAEEVRAAAAPTRAESGSTLRPAAQQKDDTRSPARRAMALAMSRARDQVAPMTLLDEVDVHSWWGKESATLRLIRAIEAACRAEPNLNALYEDDRLTPASGVNLGLAVDSPRGLFVPVLRDIGARTDEELLQQIDTYKRQARESGINREDLQGATILLSNFGALAGRFATPVVMPPTVAIIGAGRTVESVVPIDGKPAVRPLLPLSVSADHRAVTGGELARFLAALGTALSK
ncbi:Dihydrolipoyllysine-residue acetyltransferase component of pyruvate dehydrogenase complex [Microbulbifer aggregans]|uniref:Dihydrolipoamide acetyltransferase component of pyruvate dehydrogenase complex n=1 Tax=Microbulbifer aggregans TaxID=1769779 RepID=A0A1C9W5B7_9GAMM|nr:dihydrolipoamide acetyltransferase family protein [Microbulbifer aggregans]AOS96345.1 Dihydrolipoyllysine-residue acetyltransferase component of pyruvate dehydrogenase complex [Microbulbifer aggregans]